MPAAANKCKTAGILRRSIDHRKQGWRSSKGLLVMELGAVARHVFDSFVGHLLVEAAQVDRSRQHCSQARSEITTREGDANLRCRSRVRGGSQRIQGQHLSSNEPNAKPSRFSQEAPMTNLQ